MKEDNSIYFMPASGKADIGESKFFGAPDLPENFDWPADSEGFDMEFICQINCCDAHKFNSEIPESGMLYFFGCIAEPLGVPDAPKISEGFQSMGYFSVKYEDVPAPELQSGEIVDINGDPIGFKEIKIEFSKDENVCTEMYHKLLGGYPEGTDTDELSDYRLLLCLDSFSGEDFDLEFQDSGYLYFLIKENDLTNKDFSKVICYLAI
ncbi:MAG: DUF1963 domain-containing protein [Clostridiales bacterium]|nr:DUF1963 domain-containing protein [Clostridiales bacterium]